MFFKPAKGSVIGLEEALPGRSRPIFEGGNHAVLGPSMMPPFPEGVDLICFGMGCFWGAERKLWMQSGVYVTAVGYAGGLTPNPTYKEVCSGLTGHAEVVLVAFEGKPEILHGLLKVFWESHDPTQGMRQGNDRGTQYRSAIYASTEGQRLEAEYSMKRYQMAIDAASAKGCITTEIRLLDHFYYAEDYHQQYLFQNPDGYCGLKGLGIPCS